MSFDCYCDYDQPEFVSSAMRMARKSYRCEECSAPILPGEHHEYTVGKWDGSLYSFRVCKSCLDLRKFVAISVPCFCWAYSNMIEDAKEAVSEAVYRAGDEVAGLRFGLGRRLVAIRRARVEKAAFTFPPVIEV